MREMDYENRSLGTNLDSIWNRFSYFYLFLMVRDVSAASGRESSFAKTPKTVAFYVYFGIT